MKRVLAALVAAIIGCLAASSTALAGPTHITCDPQHNYALQCKGAAPFAGRNPLVGGRLTLTGPVYGTDTYGSAGAVAGSPLTNFDISYLSGVAGKDWTRAGLDWWHENNKPTGFVWEQGATQAENGCGQGTVDAQHALAEANALGAPPYSVIHAAVDSDLSGASVKNYFICWEHVLGPERAGDYGSYFVVRDLNEWGIISGRASWETRAWSQGMRYANAALYQYAIPPMAGTSIAGTGVDLDVATQADWGQFPYAQKPPVNPHHYAWLPDARRTFKVNQSGRQCMADFGTCNIVHARERLAVKTFDHTGCVLDKTTHHFKRHACKMLARHMRLLAGRVWNIAHHTKSLKHKAAQPRWGAHHNKFKGHTTTLGGAYRQLHRRIYATAPIPSW